MKEIFIPISKTRTIIMTLGSFGFVILGMVLIYISFYSIFEPLVTISLNIIGISSILFFGLCSWIWCKKAFSSSLGLKISKDGIEDSSTGLSFGLVPWQEVKDIKITKINSESFISVYVINNEKYLNRGNRLQRLANKANIGLVGTPINLTHRGLKADLDEIYNHIVWFQKQYAVHT